VVAAEAGEGGAAELRDVRQQAVIGEVNGQTLDALKCDGLQRNEGGGGQLKVEVAVEE
jgi:hypothetical protein